MTDKPDFPSLGATLFFGLTFATLITQGPPETVYANPQETMAETKLDAPPDKAPFVAQVSWSSFLQPIDPNLLRTAIAPLALTAPDVAYLNQTTAAAPIEVAQLAPKAFGIDAIVSAAWPTLQQQPHRQVKKTEALVLASTSEALPPKGPHPRTPRAQTAIVTITSPASETLSFFKPKVWPQAASLSLPTVAEAQAPEQKPPSPKTRVVRVTGDRVFLRRNPGSSGTPIDQYDTGTAALLREIRGQWRRVTIAQQTGWMFERYLSPNQLD